MNKIMCMFGFIVFLQPIQSMLPAGEQQGLLSGVSEKQQSRLEKLQKVCRIVGAPWIILEDGNYTPLVLNGWVTLPLLAIIPIVGMAKQPGKFDETTQYGPWCLNSFWNNSTDPGMQYLSNCIHDSQATGLPCGSLANVTEPRATEHCCLNLIVALCNLFQDQQAQYYNEHVYPREMAQAWRPTQIALPVIVGAQFISAVSALGYYKIKRWFKGNAQRANSTNTTL